MLQATGGDRRRACGSGSHMGIPLPLDVVLPGDTGEADWRCGGDDPFKLPFPKGVEVEPLCREGNIDLALRCEILSALRSWGDEPEQHGFVRIFCEPT